MHPALDPAFRYYAMAAAVVALHLFTLAGITGTVRAKRKVFVNPEDAKLNKGDQAEVDHPDVLRVKRAHQNLIESAIPFFGVGALYVATGGTERGTLVYCATFVVARVLHTIFYMLGVQPFRTMSFAIGAFAVIGMAVHVLRAVV